MRLRLTDKLDVLLVSDAEQIRWLNAHPNVLRPIDANAGFLHRILARRLLVDLAFHGQPLPVFVPRSDTRRSARQVELHQALDHPAAAAQEVVDSIAHVLCPATRAKAASRQTSHASAPPAEQQDSDIRLGALAQAWCGRLFDEDYSVDAARYAAGRLLGRWPSTPPWQSWQAEKSGALDAAKSRVSATVRGDLHAIHATSIGMENIATTLREMRQLADQGKLGKLGAERAMRQCLKVPPVLVRGCEREIQAPFLAQPLTKHTLILFLLGRAYRKTNDLALAFLADSWSACPARDAVPTMLQEAWHRAEAEQEKHSGLSGLIERAKQKVPELAWGMWRSLQPAASQATSTASNGLHSQPPVQPAAPG